MSKMKASTALVKVLEAWEVKHVYGIPGSSVNALMTALHERKDYINYVQVRHEAAGAMAATAYSKFSRKIGVAFGSGGPGASNLINGLYDAKMDRVPMLALVGQSDTQFMNTSYFQEMDQNPLYEDVSVYNKVVMNAQQIPYVIDLAIKAAYKHNGVATVVLPNDLMDTVIEYHDVSATVEKAKYFDILESDLDFVKKALKEAKRPLIYVGLGMRTARDYVHNLAEKYSATIVSSAPSQGYSVSTDHPNFMGPFGRLGTKPAYEAIQTADLILFMGSNHPFARHWPQDKTFIQINNNIDDIGKQIRADYAIVADGPEFIEKLLKDNDDHVEESLYLKANKINKKNWDVWLNKRADNLSSGLTEEAVIKQIRLHSTDDAMYGLDVGNNTMQSVRGLNFNKNQEMAMSGWFATLGYGLPASLGAKLEYPERQVWSISGDGGFVMNMQEIITQAKYELPIINVVMTNLSYGFIQHAQIKEDFLYGVDIADADFAKAAEALGAVSYKVETEEELKHAFKEAIQKHEEGLKQPILIEAKVKYFDPVDTSYMTVDPDLYDQETIDAYNKQYDFYGQPALSEIMKSMK